MLSWLSSGKEALLKTPNEILPLSLLKLVSNQLDRCRNLDFEQMDLTSSQANIMMFLFANRHRPVTHQDIQLSLHLSHPTITGLMQRLETKGFVERTANPLDNRCKFVKLTEKGEKLERRLKMNSKALERMALEDITDQQLSVFNSTLYEIARNLLRSRPNLTGTLSDSGLGIEATIKQMHN